MKTLREQFDAGEICIDRMTQELFNWLKENRYYFTSEKDYSFWADKKRICYKDWVCHNARSSYKKVTVEEFLKEVKLMRYVDVKEGEKFIVGDVIYQKKNGLPWNVSLDYWSSNGMAFFNRCHAKPYVEKTESEIELEKLGQQIEELTEQYNKS